MKLKEQIFSSDFIAVDTETTGFNWQKNDYAFGVGVYNNHGGVYFDERKSGLSEVVDLLNSFRGSIFLHNAKFDMHFLKKLGVTVSNPWCTAAMHRLVNNILPSYRLADLGKRIGYEKDTAVEEWISKNKAYTWVQIPGKKKREKDKHFEKVPLEIIEKYCIRDAEVCFKLGEYQYEKLKNYNIAKNEVRLTKTLFDMEERGVLLDEKYTRDCLDKEDQKILEAMGEFKELTGEKFVDSGKALSKIFDRLGIGYPTTEKGNPSFKSDVLEKVAHPIKDIIFKQRKAYKKGYTYFANYLYMADGASVIHGSFNQGGAATGRMSASNPNLQNVTKQDVSDSLVRRCFIARPGFKIASFDYDQMEYRMALNYSGEMGIISQVLDGLDVHTATATMMNVPRDVAKTVNFLLLYGGGPTALMEAIGCSYTEAVAYFDNYHENIPAMSKYFKRTIDEVYKKGYITNPFGRKCKVHKGYEYKAVNYQIQGGCADVVKYALNECSQYLSDKESHIVSTVHDEINIELKEGEEYVLPCIKNIMENVSKTPYLTYTCGLKIGPNFQDLADYEL